MKTLDDIMRELHPPLPKLERERDMMEAQRRFYEVTGILAPFPLSFEDLAALHTRRHILGLRRTSRDAGTL